MDKDRTKLLILSEFNDLLARIPLEKITVQMLIRKCDISRATFYRYFDDKYDIMNYNFKEYMYSHLGNKELKDWYGFFLNMIDEGERNKARLINEYKTTGDNAYLNHACECSYRVLKEMIEAKRPSGSITGEEEVQLSVFCYGRSYAVRDYLFNRYSTTPEQFSAQVCQFIPEFIECVWE